MTRAVARVDAVTLEARASVLARRTIKSEAKRAGIDLAVREACGAALGYLAIVKETPGKLLQRAKKQAGAYPGVADVACV